MENTVDQNEIYRAIGRLESKVDAVLNTVSETSNKHGEFRKEFHDKHDKLDGRLCNVENKMNWAAGVGVVIGFLFTQAIAPIKRLFGV